MHAITTVKKQEDRIAALEQEIAHLQGTLGRDEDADAIVRKHIKSLHRYNESKDATQVRRIYSTVSAALTERRKILMGRLAGHRQVTIRQMYNEYGLTDQD